jgi:hypothetical protein
LFVHRFGAVEMPLPVVEVAEESRRVDGVGMGGNELLELLDGLMLPAAISSRAYVIAAN